MKNDNSTKLSNASKPMLGDVLIIDVPNGSYDFIVHEWDDFNEIHEMQYKVKTNYTGTFGVSFGRTETHTEGVSIEKKGNWIIEKVESNKVFLKNIAQRSMAWRCCLY
jgi:hypothetical protein